MSERVRKLTELAVLTGLALIIFAVELQIPNPFPIPGIKLGLANIITVYAVYHYRAHEVAALVAVRLILGSVITGNLSALIYSAAAALTIGAAIEVPLSSLYPPGQVDNIDVPGAYTSHQLP